MRNLCLMLSLCMATLAYAQDVIVLKDGSSILSKVIEVGSSEVKYKKWSNLDGPTYILNVSEVLSINYQDGGKEKSSVIVSDNTSQSKKKILSSQSSPDYVKKQISKGMNVAGYVVGLGGLFGCLTTGVLLHKNGTVGTGGALGIGLGGGFACLLIGGAIGNRADRLLGSSYAIEDYNLYKHDIKIGNAVLSPELNLLTDNYAQECTLGIGLSYSF